MPQTQPRPQGKSANLRGRARMRVEVPPDQPETYATPVLDPGNPEAMEKWFQDQAAAGKNHSYSEIGKELARILGAGLVAEMLKESGLSLHKIQDQFGYQPAALSRMANGKTLSGPTLWKVFALAEALGFRIELTAHKK